MRIRERRIAGMAGVALLILLAGCDSTGPATPEYFMRFDVGGSQVYYNHPATLTGSLSENDSQYIGVFSGFSTSSSLTLQIYSAAPIVTGTTYSGYGLSGGMVVGAVIGYQHTNGVQYTQGASGTINSHIRLSEISATHIRGVFSGVVRAAGHPDLTITNGEFTVRRL